MSYSWIKLYMEILDDPKMARMSDHLWRRTIEIFLLAGKCGQAGELPSLEDMAWILRTDADALSGELADLEKRGIITELETGGWVVTKFAERQGASPVNIRVKEHRERKQAQERQIPPPPPQPDPPEPPQIDPIGNDNVTECYIECNDAKVPDTDTDKDTDKEDTQKKSSSPPSNSSGKRGRSKKPPDPRREHESVKTYRGIMHRQLNDEWLDDVINTIGGRAEEWRAVLKDWAGSGYNPGNIRGMLDAFRAGGVKGPTRSNGSKPPQDDSWKQGYSRA